MVTIHKYPLEPGQSSILAPKGARMLSVAAQGDQPCVWALVDTDQPIERREITFIGTGWDMQESPGRFVGTCTTYGGKFVWHLFDKTPA